MGMDGFVWFVGVVEDRNDPEQLGRVRVRCLGFHTEDLTKLPTADLPWAHVMHPVTDPSMQGMGNSPTFLVEGSWVIGFFRDASAKQQPIIIGSLPGVPNSAPDPTKGFSDPRGSKSIQPDYNSQQPAKTGPGGTNQFGPYPVDGKEVTRFSGHGLGEQETNSGQKFVDNDVSRLARGQISEEHFALLRRRVWRETDNPIARRPTMGATEGRKDEQKVKVWAEPLPKSIKAEGVTKTREVETEEGDDVYDQEYQEYQSAVYPFNHVYESEAGHIFEIDDTPGGERIHREHSSGTFEEIHPKGDKVVKVIGNNYEIVAGSAFVHINGTCNVLIDGDKNEYIKGDYVLEVEGDHTRSIGKNMRTKIGAKGTGNKTEEVIGNFSYNYSGDVKGTVHGDFSTIIKGSEKRIVSGIEGYNLSVQKDMLLQTSDGTISIVSGKKITAWSEDDIIMVAGGKAEFSSIEGTVLKSDASTTVHAGTLADIASIGTMAISSTSSVVDVTAATILDLNSGGGTNPTSVNRINLN